MSKETETMNPITSYLSGIPRQSLFGALLGFACLVLASLGAAGASASLGLDSFDGGAFTGIDGGMARPIGAVVNQAGAHPTTASTNFLLTQQEAANGWGYATEDLEDVTVDLPPGLVGNVNVLPTCRDSELAGGASSPSADIHCAKGSQVGFVDVRAGGDLGVPSPGHPGEFIPDHTFLPVFNMRAPQGKAALLGFQIFGAVFHVSAVLRRDEVVAGKYHVRFTSLNAPQTVPLVGAGFTVWGAPADPLLQSVHGWGVENGGPPINGAKVFGPSCVNSGSPGCPNGALGEEVRPFFTLPTSCEGPVETDITVTSWEGSAGSDSFLSHGLGGPSELIGNEGCNAVDFSPSLEARPTTNVADSPSGLDVDLHIPQHENCTQPPGPVTCELAEAHLKDTTVTLPEGMTVNPSSANGLDACTEAEIELDGGEPADCPDASRLGGVEVITPLLAERNENGEPLGPHPVLGSVYIAQPFENPFDSLLALYIALDDPQSGTVVKVAGEVKADPVTGQLTATFEENPQVPFEDFRLHFFGGAGGSLRTPAVCGNYSTTSSLTPWSAPDSGPPATPSDTWAIQQGPGGSCANSAPSLPNKPSFQGGTVSPIAGAHTPVVINLRREDGTQEFAAVTLSPPQGLVGKLAGIPYCSQAALDEAAAKSGRAEEASQSCPQASYVGSVTAGAGAGPAPYYAPGKAYLTGPYKGAPLSLAIVTPATAGPFDLGTIVVRTALYVDRTTAQITAVSDPIPAILQGIPLDVRSVQVRMDRPDFTINPTSCKKTTFGGQLLTTLGQTTPLQSRFQLGECGRLAFKPKLTLELKGQTKRTGHPALTATLRMPEGSANLASISAALPHSEFLDQSHIGTVCTRVQFKADECPAASVYGTATVTTPLLDYQLTGNVYLRSSDNPLPDLVPDLRGPASQPIKLEADGRVDSVNGGIRNTFDFVPDAAFTKFTLQMRGGRKGLLENSTNLCKGSHRATVKYVSHSGKAITLRPVLKAECGKKKKSKQAKKHRRR